MVKLNGFFRLVAGITLFAFCEMQGLLAMHHHEAPRYQVSAKQTKSGATVEKSELKCQICDFIVHQQHKHAHFPHLIQLPLKTSLPYVLSVEQLPALYKQAVLSWTNKGPPSC